MDTGAGSRSISRVGETVPTSLAESQRVPPLGARTAGSDMRGASALVSVEDRARIAASEHIAPELAQIWQPSPPIARWEGGRLVPVVDTERNPQLRDFIEMINWFNRERPRTKYDGIYPYHTDGGDIYTGKGRTRASGYAEQLKYGHGLVGPALIAEISNPALTPRPIVDAFAGRGYLGWVMGKNGVPLVSFDCAPIGSGVNLRADLIPLSVAYPRQFGTRRSAPSGEAATGNEWFSEGVSWSRVLPGNESFLKLQNWNAGKYPQTMIISYPPDNTNDAARALYNFSGRHLIYLGQTPGGVTGTRDFFDLLDRNWKLTKILDNPHVPGYQDRVFIFDRLKPSQERTTPAKFDGQLTMKSLTGGYSSRPGRTQEWIVGLLPR